MRARRHLSGLAIAWAVACFGQSDQFLYCSFWQFHTNAPHEAAAIHATSENSENVGQRWELAALPLVITEVIGT